METGRRCVWCGAPANSKEHVYPQWLHSFQGPKAYITKHGPVQPPEPRLVARINALNELVEYEYIRGKQVPNLHQVKVKAVCRACNSGWMSRMETAVKPLVERLVLPSMTSPTTLTPDDQEKLAAWVHKCFLMYAQWSDREDRPFGPEDYATFYNERLPHGDVRIYMGASRSPLAEFATWIEPQLFIPHGAEPAEYARRVGRNCCSAFLAVDGLVFIEHWFSSQYPSENLTARWIRYRSDAKARRSGVAPIWPTTGHEISWPDKILGHADTEAARLSLFRYLARLRVAAKRVPTMD